MLIASFLAVPVVNLLGPLFATSLMVHLYKAIAAGERRAGGVLAGS
jgi:CysZ protein